ncbi:hypothetical protein [Nocardia sp. NPDC052112]|uniref:hypothetical protein n=1 Tax=Nocardia sp. NPDC052112 TaxID=3155646 RepID=UPI0034308D88
MPFAALATISILCIAAAVTALTASMATDSLATKANQAAKSCFIGDNLPTDAYFASRSRSTRLSQISTRLMTSGVLLLLLGVATLALAAWQHKHTGH